MNPFMEDTRAKVKVTTTVHPAFLEWLKENQIKLATWIENQYEIGEETSQKAELQKRVRFFAQKTMELQDEIKALKFRLEMLEKDKYQEKVSKPSKRKEEKNPMFKGNKHGGIV